MLKTIIRAWNNMFCRQWAPYGDADTGQFRMRRWNGDAWETRDATPEEAQDARLDWAIR